MITASELLNYPTPFWQRETENSHAMKRRKTPSQLAAMEKARMERWSRSRVEITPEMESAIAACGGSIAVVAKMFGVRKQRISEIRQLAGLGRKAK